MHSRLIVFVALCALISLSGAPWASPSGIAAADTPAPAPTFTFAPPSHGPVPEEPDQSSGAQPEMPGAPPPQAMPEPQAVPTPRVTHKPSPKPKPTHKPSPKPRATPRFGG
jgi:outer membrane biosynthesis protein TonB